MLKNIITAISFMGIIGISFLLTLSGCAQNPPAPSTSIIASSATNLPTTTTVSISPTASRSPIPPGTAAIQKVTLITGGFGYTVGDIVLIDTAKEPAPGDVVQYNSRVNKSDMWAFGPVVNLAKIIGLPGDAVSFKQWSYEVNGLAGEIVGSPSSGVHISGTPRTLWGNQEINNISDYSGRELKVPENEYLADKLIGQEGRGTDEHGSGIPYIRYTINREALIGVVIEKIGHDQEFEDQQKRVVY
jgi:hypothetical protein